MISNDVQPTVRAPEAGETGGETAFFSRPA